MKVLVTGAGGFVGGALADRLRAAGHELVLPTRSGLSTALASEVRAIPAMETMTRDDWRRLLSGVDAVVHSAAIAHIGRDVPRDVYMAVNRDAAARLAEAAAAERVQRFVFLSSIRAQVGPTSRIVQDERTPPAPAEPYGESKLAAERLISAAFPAATHLRPPLIVGRGARGNLAQLVRLAASPLPLPFASFDAPQASISLPDAVAAVEHALEHPAACGETYVLADPEHLSLAAMVAILREGMGRRPGLVPLPMPLLRIAARAANKTDAFERISEGLRVDAGKLLAAGWRPRQSVCEALLEIGRAARSGGAQAA